MISKMTSRTVNAEIENWTSRVLRGEPAPWGVDESERWADAIGEYCERHGVGGLVYYFGRRNAEWGNWPEILRDWLSRRAKWLAINEKLQAEALRSVLVELAEQNIDLLQLKGVAMAYQHYPEPWLRSRGDSDILVREAHRERVERALENSGYRRRESITGKLVSYQAKYSQTDSSGFTHIVDVHWRLSTSQPIAGLFTFDALWRSSGPVHIRGFEARALGRVHALVHAVMHRAVHMHAPHYGAGTGVHRGDRLVWLYDINLLAKSLDERDWTELLAIVTERRLAGPTLDAFHAAQERFAFTVPADVSEALASLSQCREPAMLLLRGSRLWANYADLRALSFVQRVRWMIETAVPSADYLLRRYETRSRWLLPYLYVHRLYTGLSREWRSRGEE